MPPQGAALRDHWPGKLVVPGIVNGVTRTLTIIPPNANYTFHLYAAALRIAGVTAPKDLRITYGFGGLGFNFTGDHGAIYTLWRSANLRTWTQIPFPFIVIGNGGPTSFPMVPVFSDKHYFRVQAE